MELPGIHLLQAAIMLAEVRNYSRAARKLGILQPTLSKRITELEHFVGFPLFVRSTQSVEPTEACRVFIEEAKQTVFHAERGLYLARSTEKGARTILHVGRSQYTDPYLISVLNSIELPLYPNLEVSMSSMYSGELESEILLGKLDIAIAVGHFESAKITQLELMRTPFYIVVQESSSLARHERLTMVDLASTAWLLFERHVHPQLYDQILDRAEQLQVRPRVVRHGLSAEEAAQELYTGNGEAAFLTRAGAWRIARNGLTMRPLDEAQLAISTKVIAKANDSSRIVSEFVRALKRKLEKVERMQLSLPLRERRSS